MVPDTFFLPRQTLTHTGVAEVAMAAGASAETADQVGYWVDFGVGSADIGTGILKGFGRRSARGSAPRATDSLPSGTGVLGGQLYGADRLAKLEGYLGRRGVQLKVGDEFVPKGKAAGFAIDGSELVLPSNPTQYTVWHELAHFRQFQKFGPEAYQALPRPANFSGLQNVPEQYVFDTLENSSRRWNALNHAEQQHAIWSIETVYGGIR